MSELTAQVGKSTAPVAAPDTTLLNGDVRLDPDMMKRILFESDTTVLLGLNRLHQAKDEVNLARAALLPSLNLGALLFSGPAFILSSVEFLVPFLVPSKWFEVNRMRSLLEAERASFRLLQLNEYASAYAIYLSVQNDQGLKAIYDEEVADLAAIAQSVERASLVGIADSESLERARGQLQMAKVNASRVSDLVHQELASLRKALALGTEARISITPVDVTPSTWEGQSLETALEAAMQVSPERQQINYLQDAAKTGKWEKFFGFLGDFGLKGTPGSATSKAFSGLSAHQNLSIGFSIVPALKISQRDEQALVIRQAELRLETRSVLEIAQGSVAEALDRLGMATQAEASFGKVYRARLSQYELGIGGVTPALLARAQLRQATIESLRARTQVSLTRVSLHRALLTERFGEIPGCTVEPPESMRD